MADAGGGTMGARTVASERIPAYAVGAGGPGHRLDEAAVAASPESARHVRAARGPDMDELRRAAKE